MSSKVETEEKQLVHFMCIISEEEKLDRKKNKWKIHVFSERD